MITIIIASLYLSQPETSFGFLVPSLVRCKGLCCMILTPTTLYFVAPLFFYHDLPDMLERWRTAQSNDKTAFENNILAPQHTIIQFLNSFIYIWRLFYSLYSFLSQQSIQHLFSGNFQLILQQVQMVPVLICLTFVSVQKFKQCT